MREPLILGQHVALTHATAQTLSRSAARHHVHDGRGFRLLHHGRGHETPVQPLWGAGDRLLAQLGVAHMLVTGHHLARFMVESQTRETAAALRELFNAD